MKICCACKVNKEDRYFHKSKSHKGGLASKCKDCIREYQKQRRILHHEEILSKEKILQKKNKDTYNSNRRKKRAENPQEVRDKENNLPSRINGGSGKRSKLWREKHPDYVSEYGQRNPDKMANSQKKSKYGLTREEILTRAEEQDNKCWVCRKEFENFSSIMTDHDHSCCDGAKSCGKCVRGLLCRFCNFALGAFFDNPISLSRAVEYLNHFKKTEETL